MKTVSTFQELKSALHGEDQNSNTRCGWIIYNGKQMYIRKHWSYEGGYPAYEDEACTIDIGEFKAVTSTARPMMNEDGTPVLRHGYEQVYDFDLQLA